MISIIIPAYNAEKTIGECLQALNSQSFRGEFEVIVVDDGSADDTVVEARKCGAKVIEQEHAGPAAARNRGAKESKGGIIIFTDSDCVPDAGWIENMAKPFSDKDVAGVSGTYRTKNADSKIAQFVGYEIELRHERMKKFDRIDFIGTYSAAYKKDVFFKFGGFDTHFETSSAEDSELSFKIANAGNKLVFAPDAFVWHRHPDSVVKYLKQKFQRGYWRVLLYKMHPEKMKGETYTPPTLLLQTLLEALIFASIFALLAEMFLTATILVLAFIPYSVLFYFMSVCLLGILLINLKFFMFMFGKEKAIGLLSVPLVFLRNAAYGLGILAGIIMTCARAFRPKSSSAKG